MKLKDIVKHAAVYLGLEKVIGYVESGSYSDDGDALTGVDVLTRCANLVLNELACAYVPMIKTENLTLNGDRAYYSSLSDAPRRILCVKDVLNNDVKYETFAEYMKTEPNAATVKYEYFPPNYDLSDTVGYDESQLPARVISYGVAAEYSLTVKAFDESLMWRDRFENALKQTNRQKNTVIKGRQFI